MIFSAIPPLYAFTVIVWAAVVAYGRRAKERRKIAVQAVAMPLLMLLYAATILIFVEKSYFDWAAGSILLLASAFGYISGSIATLVWAYRAPRENEPRGFPIEPINSVAPNDSDRV